MGKRSNRQKSPEQTQRDSGSDRPNFWRSTKLVHAVLLTALCFTVFANALSGQFLWDDNIQIVRNPSIRSLDNIPHAFTSTLWAFANAGNTRDRYYRPIQNIIFTLTYAIGELSPLTYHIVSIALHAAATLMAYLFFLEFGLTAGASLVAAALFAVHPVHTEAVSWIAGLGEVACGFFYFAALWSFTRYFKKQRGVWIAASSICFFAALLSKEMSVTLPAAALLVLWMKRRALQIDAKRAALLMSPYAVILAVYGALRISVVGLSLPSTFEDHATLFDWTTFGVWMFGRYLRYAVAPYPLAAFHLTPLYFSARAGSTVICFSAIAVVIALFYYFRKSEENLLSWFAMFAVMLVPVFYFKGIAGGSVFAERYLYIPTLPAVALLATLWSRLPRAAGIVSAIAAVAIFSSMTFARNRDWNNEDAFYQANLRVYPDNAHACLNYASILLDEGKYDDAQHCLDVAQKRIGEQSFLRPREEEYRMEIELGTLAIHRIQPAEAKAHLKRAIEINPGLGDAYGILGGALINLDKNFEAAIPVLEKAISLSPTDDQARDSLGVALYNLKQYERAADYFREALRINPQSERAQQHLNTVLQRLASGSRP